ncbi:dihydroxyacetone kinase subunit DhaL [Klebsiella pneumoniae]|uniref:dihydroxyacetone kinase subunit DhaL n=1 Tax=Klebsiella pneumoniae TaxID=573 RepID=UPI003EBEC555
MSFLNKDGITIAIKMVEIIQNNKAWLSEKDGAAGDGDHGINMSKGFTFAQNKFDPTMNMSKAFQVISQVLLEEIGGSMGPLYGTWLHSLGYESASHEVIDASVLNSMFTVALAELQKLTSATPGDKTMLDALVPATQALNAALAEGQGCVASLIKMKQGAENGFNSTRKMYPRMGRASRLGERSLGHPDAGAGSCMLLLCAFADTAISLINKEANDATAH